MSWSARICNLLLTGCLVVLALGVRSSLLAAVLGNIGMIALARVAVVPTEPAAGLIQMANANLQTAYHLSPYWAYGWARVALLDADWGRARFLLNEASLVQPHNVLISYDLGRVYSSLGDNEAAPYAPGGQQVLTGQSWPWRPMCGRSRVCKDHYRSMKQR